MKILHILTSINTGGAEKFCVDLCNTQAKFSGNEIYLCILDKLEEQPLLQSISEKVNLFSLNKQNGYSLTTPYKIYKLLSDINPDVIHLNGRSMVYASIPIIIKKIPSIYTVHTMVDRENKYVNKYLKFLFNNFSLLFTPVSISKVVLNSVQNIYGFKFDEIIYNGSSKLTVSCEFDLVEKFFESLKNDIKTLCFVYIGRIEKVKNTLLLIRSFNKLLDKNKNICLCIVGYDGSPSQSYLEECKKENRYPKKIQFVGHKQNIADYLSFADASCITSNREGLGITVLESFSMGVPVLSTPSGGPSEVIVNSVNGYVSEKITVDSYIKILEKFIEKPITDKSNIVAVYENNYTMGICAMKYMDIYRKKFNKLCILNKWE